MHLFGYLKRGNGGQTFRESEFGGLMTRWPSGFGLSRSLFSRLSSRSFPMRLHPNTSLRECVRRCRQPSRSPGGPDTEDSSCDRLALHGRLNHPDAPLASRSPRATSDWPCRRGPLPQGKGRCNRNSLVDALVVPSWLGVSAELGCPVLCVLFTLLGRVNSGTEERVGGAGGGDSSPCSPARGRRNSRMDAL